MKVKKYEYIHRKWFNDRGFDLIRNLNDLGYYGYFVVSIQYIMMLDDSKKVWYYELLLAKEIS